LVHAPILGSDRSARSNFNLIDPTGLVSVSTVLKRVAGVAAIAGGVTIAGACMAATSGLGTPHCLSVGGSLSVGGAILLTT
jgi:ABC-type cobalamin transport system ATPase subunit